MAIFAIQAKMTAQTIRIASRARRPLLWRQMERWGLLCVITFVFVAWNAFKNTTQSWGTILLKSAGLALAVGVGLWILFIAANGLGTWISRLFFSIWPRTFEMVFEEEEYSKKGQKVKIFCSYDYVQEITETREYIVFILGGMPFAPDGASFYVFDKATLKGGTLDEFRTFIMAKTQQDIRLTE